MSVFVCLVILLSPLQICRKCSSVMCVEKKKDDWSKKFTKVTEREECVMCVHICLRENYSQTWANSLSKSTLKFSVSWSLIELSWPSSFTSFFSLNSVYQLKMLSKCCVSPLKMYNYILFQYLSSTYPLLRSLAIWQQSIFLSNWQKS